GLYQYRSASLVNTQDTVYRVAMALGWRLSERLRLGRAVFPVVQQRQQPGSTWQSFTILNQAGRQQYTDSTATDTSSLTAGGEVKPGPPWGLPRRPRLRPAGP